MNWSDDNKDKDWQQWLQSRFDNYEPDVRGALEEKILGPAPPARIHWHRLGIVFGILAVLGLLLTVLRPLAPGEKVGKSAVRGLLPRPQKQGVGLADERTNAASGALGKRLPAIVQTGEAVKRIGLREPVQRKRVPPSGGSVAPGEDEPYRSVDFEVPVASTDSNVEERTEQGVGIEMLPSLGPFFGNSLQNPPIAVQADVAGEDNVVGSKRLRWLVSVTPVQTFQLLTLRSTPELGYQDVRFASLRSMRSKGIKVAAGVEKAGFGLTASYAYVRNWTRYEVATDQFDVRPSSAGGFEVNRRGIEGELDDQLHLLGIGLRKSLGPYRMLDGVQNVVLGTDFARTLSKKRSMLSVYAKLGRQVSLTDKVRVSIGPYVEIGITQRTIVPGIWKYRPYQAGISLEFIK